MKSIGLLSDTHGFLDPLVFEFFAECDEIWHAGDFGVDVAEALSEFKPLRGVYGNIDDQSVRCAFPEDQRFTLESVDVWMRHIGGRPPRYQAGVLRQLRRNPPDIFVCGHSHILQVERDTSCDKMLCLNPGAAGHQGFHTMRTMLRFVLDSGQVRSMQVVELGRRGRRSTIEKGSE